MIIRKRHRILVVGMTGRQGSFWSQALKDYGATIVGGVNPKKAGQMHLGVPVYASAKEAARETGFDVALMFVPPMAVKGATIDASEAGAETVICLAEHVPTQDVLEVIATARHNGSRVIGPNTAGLVTPGETFAGIMPAFERDVFRPGDIGVISRSGSLGTLACLNLTRDGFGQSAFCGIGGDPVVGTTMREALELMEADDRTRAVVLCGEIGGRSEEVAAEFAQGMSKPVIAFIAGKSSPKGRKMGHAGAVISGGRGSYLNKLCALKLNGVAVADLPSQIPLLVRDAIMSGGDEAPLSNGVQTWNA